MSEHPAVLWALKRPLRSYPLNMVEHLRVSVLNECPECGANWDGGDILEIWKELRAAGTGYVGYSDEQLEEMYRGYSKPRRFHRLIGVEHSERYDGISQWQCPDCGAIWCRWTNRLLQSGKPASTTGDGDSESKSQVT